ncbi:peroxidase family protein [Hyphococcus sp.]|uniref:peroxidase family protein n=1 Tax=Hyphococcus sp. TaxID=2038636 RepID=UPI003D134C2A
MRIGVLLGASAAALAMATAAEARRGDERAEHQHPAQNIERDVKAQTKARLRHRFGAWAPAFHQGREVRSFDGSGNNLSDPEAGAAFAQLVRLTPQDYADGISEMSGQLRKGPREISNIVVDQAGQSFPGPFGTSDFLWQWGQFVDHDFALGDGVKSDDRSHDIPIPLGDPHFDPFSEGGKWIRFDRAIFDEETGTDLSNPREQMNEITSWLDGSMIYGSSDERASALRTNDGTGRLKTSKGDLLPFNTGLLPNANEGPIDPAKLFLAGDVRSNEQVGLTVMHTLFVREHNRWADYIRKTRPWFSGDDVFHAARRMVIAEIQIITYEEFLPALIGKRALPRYRGYEPGDPGLFTEFSGATWRLGHTLINAQLLRVDARGREIAAGHLPLRNAFFNAPMLLKKRDDLDPVLRGLASQKSQTYDNMIVDDLRNFLFGPPGAGGFDLAALNIQRGRDRGLCSLNDARKALGLKPHKDFSDITSNPSLQEKLRAAYGTVDDIDLWVGGISEDALAREGSQLGETFREIVILQFTALRDHDRFWWERDLTRAEQLMVKKTTLADVILANTSIKRREIPKNVFYVEEDKKGGGGWPYWPW